MHERCAHADGRADRVADPGDSFADVDIAADERHLVHGGVVADRRRVVHARSIRSSASCCSRRSFSASSIARIVSPIVSPG